MHRCASLLTFVGVSAVAFLLPPAASAATIRGRVVAADTGMSLPRAAVILSSREPRESRTTTADAQGRYEFRDIAPGRYTLSASKAGFVRMAYGQTLALESGQTIELITDNEVREPIDFRMLRAGVITGRVTDDLGEPVAEARISVHRYEFIAGLRRLASFGRTVQTNDLGEFRLYGLPAGHYYLGATTSYTPTYYPGTVRAAEAQLITIVGGQEVSNIAMSLLPVRASRVSGTAIDASGRPMFGATVMAMESFAASLVGQVRSDGSFTITGLAPGEYTISASQRIGDAHEIASVTVIMNGEDLTGLTLVAQKPATVRGRIVFDVAGAADRSPINADALHVQALRASPEESVALGLSTSRIDAEGLFEVRAPPGPTILRFATLPQGWQLNAVRVNGLDVTDAGLDLQSDQVLDDVELVISNRISEVSGMVIDRGKQLVSDVSVVIYPEDRRQWHFQSRFLARSRPDERGRFTATRLPPGKYLAIAVGALGPGEEMDPEFLQRALARASRFSLLEGEIKALDLTLQTLP